jgi:electron transfer flavoprotein alpha subunit
MSTVLVIGEIEDGFISDFTRELITAAIALGDTIILGIASSEIDFVKDLTNITGVESLVTISTHSPHFDAEIQRTATDALIDHIQPEVIVMPFNYKAASFAGAIAEKRNLGFATDVVDVYRDSDGLLRIVRPIYGSRVLAEIGFSTQSPVLVLLRASKWEPANVISGVINHTHLEFSAKSVDGLKHIEFIHPTGEIDLKSANIIFSLGRGVGSTENIEKFEVLAEKMGVTLGASRPLVDAGWLPAGHQVGQTGTTVKPNLYVAFGISGAIQHLAGMSGAKKILAINTDESAPIFAVAHFGATVDMMEVAEELNNLL